MDSENPSRSTRVKRIAINARVSGKFGDFNKEGSNKRRKRRRIFGTVIEAGLFSLVLTRMLD